MGRMINEVFLWLKIALAALIIGIVGKNGALGVIVIMRAF